VLTINDVHLRIADHHDRLLNGWFPFRDETHPLDVVGVEQHALSLVGQRDIPSGLLIPARHKCQVHPRFSLGSLLAERIDRSLVEDFLIIELDHYLDADIAARCIFKSEVPRGVADVAVSRLPNGPWIP